VLLIFLLRKNSRACQICNQ